MTASGRAPLRKVGSTVRGARPQNLVERRMTRFLREPPSVQLAASVIVTATALVVVAGGVLMRVLDHKEYASVWVGMWWALQTVTTVGYGDVTPKAPVGRVIASFTMFEGIAFLAIVTAAITSTFVARAERERGAGSVYGRLDEIDRRLEQIGSVLDELASQRGPR